MSRRTTLGPLSSSASNARAQQNNGRLSMAAKPAVGRPSMGRPSLGGRALSTQTNGRPSLTGRSSGGGGRASLAPSTGRPSFERGRPSMYGSSGGAKKDPRPLKDNEFQITTIRKLIAFFAAHQYDAPMTVKSLRGPTQREFRTICSFLIRQLDPQTDLKPENPQFDDLLRFYLQFLGYPFTISKSILASPGSPHVWPTLLAMLGWLVELCTYAERAGPHMFEASMDDWMDSAQMDKCFFAYLRDSYREYLQGKDFGDNVADDLSNYFQDKTRRIMEDNEKLLAGSEALKQAINRMTDDPDTVPAAQEKKDKVLKDYHAYVEFVARQEDHIKKQLAKMENLDQAEEQQQLELKEAKEERARLEKALSEQTLSAVEVQRMASDAKMLEEQLAAGRQASAEISRQSYEMEIALCKLNEAITKKAETYNEKAQVLEQQLSAARYEGEAPPPLELNLGGSLNQLVLPDLTRAVKPVLRATRTCFSDRYRMGEEELQRAQETAVRAQNILGEVNEDHRIFEERLKKLEETFSTEREDMNKQLSDLQAQVQTTDMSILKLKNTHFPVAATQKKIADLLEKKSFLASQHKKQSEALHDDLVATMEAAMKHRQEIQELIKGAANHVYTMQQAVSNM